MSKTVDYRVTDSQTGLWTEEWLKKKIQDYFSENGTSGTASFCLVEMVGDEQEREHQSEFSPALKRFAFFLGQSLRKSDIAARVGNRYFAVFLPGCNNRKKVEERLSFLCENLRESLSAADGAMRAGVLICRGPEFSYEDAARSVKGALYRAKQNGESLGVVYQGDLFTEEETGWFMEPVSGAGTNRSRADMEFIGRIIETLFFPEVYPPDIDEALEELGRYFGSGICYILEKIAGETGFEISHNWQKQKSRVMNYNLNRLPGIVGERYSKMFDRDGLFVCNTTEALKDLDPVMAQRQRLRGTRALMQCTMIENGNYVGYITVADTERERLWTNREIATFSIAGKLLGACLLEMRAGKRLEMASDQDSLTEAWNYKRFLVKGGERLHTGDALQAVVTVDIKNFKTINTQYGYEEGDEVLRQLGSLFNFFTRGRECYARIEADKFVLLLEYSSFNGLQQRMKQLIRRIEQIPENRLGVSITCTAGLCLVEQGDRNMSVLVDHASMARNSLKDYHKSSFCFYNKEAEQKLMKERELALRMKSAVKKEEFVVYYQPKVSLNQKKIIGLEALVRWRNSDGNLIPPNDFIPLFEKNGFIIELDMYVFEHVCRLMHSWMEAGRKLVPIAVNISRIHIKEADLVKKLTAICKKYGIAPEMMELELTESAFLHNQDMIMNVAREIKKAGFILSMDDFGTGYSSLSLLKDLPVDIVKLDREFFQKQVDWKERVIVTNVIHMVMQLNIQVVSEGIETEESETFLKEIGCELAQGYRYSQPVPVEVIEKMLFEESENPCTPGQMEGSW